MVKVGPNHAHMEEMLDHVAIEWHTHCCNYLGSKANAKMRGRWLQVYTFNISIVLCYSTILALSSPLIGFSTFLDHLRIVRNDRSRDGKPAYAFVHDISLFLQYQSL